MFKRWMKRKEPPPPPERTFVPRVRKYSAPVIRYTPRPEPIPEGRIQIDRAPGEPDRGSAEYRIAVLCAGIRKASRTNRLIEPYDGGGGW